MTRAALGLGSNLGDRAATLQSAVRALLDDSALTPYAVSPVYETAPVGGIAQPDYLNAVLVVETVLAPGDLVSRALAVEARSGRDRSREQRWGPRPLDVDVLAVGGLVSADPAATVPHPRLHERAFVLVPWGEVDPTFVVPGRGTVAELLAAVDPVGVLRRPDLALELP